MVFKKLAPMPRALWHLLNNDAGFGRKIVEPGPQTSKAVMGAIVNAAENFMEQQVPEGQIRAGWDLMVTGDGDKKVNALQLLGPLAGVTFSKGAPGGPAVGEYLDLRRRHQYELDAALPDIRKQILRGDTAGATQRMIELGVPPGLIRFYTRTATDPSSRLSGHALRDLYRYMTPEERGRFEGYRQRQ